MTRRRRRLSTLVVTLGAAAMTVCASASAARAVSPTLYVNYTNNCTFTITGDGGNTVTSIAPGAYQVQVVTPQVFADEDLSGGDPNMLACNSFVQFQLTGPGVSISTTLQQGDEDFGIFAATFLPSSTYVALDNNQPSVTQTTFTTLASGSPTAPSIASGSSTAGTSSSTSSGGSSTALGTASASKTSGDTPLLGSLTASVSATGRLTMTFKGKAVATLAKGRYTITVTDKSKKSGFILQGTGQKAIVVSAAGFVGKRSTSIDLTAGQWYYYPTFVGKKTYFLVESAE